MRNSKVAVTLFVALQEIVVALAMQKNWTRQSHGHFERTSFQKIKTHSILAIRTHFGIEYRVQNQYVKAEHQNNPQNHSIQRQKLIAQIGRAHV